MSNNLTERVRLLDGHSSVSNEFRVRTKQGAALSVLTLVIITYLIYTEYVFNFTTSIQSKVHVNSTSSIGIEIDFDITFGQIPCALLSIDANDPSGQQQSLHLNKAHHIWKQRLGADGESIGSRKRENQEKALKNEGDLEVLLEEKLFDLSSNFDVDCGSCYGANETADECCSTCEDVKRAYSRRNWHLADLHTILQCHNTKTCQR